MIRNGGLYTLLGTKPMTEFDITDTLDKTEQEIAQSYEELKVSLREQKSSNCSALPTFEEYVKKCNLQREELKFGDCKILWDTWLKTYGTVSTPTYKLIAWKGDFTAGLFIHVPHLIYTLKKYYREFSQITGIQFDVDTILNSIEDKNSVFWRKVLTNHYLHGLLLGYGERNAYLFNWVRKEALPLESVSILRFPELSRLNQHAKQILKKKVSIDDLPIPYFVSFEINDEEIERYSKEQKKIISFMKDKDFTSFILKCLLPTSQTSSVTQIAR
ncbi:MAG: hypothetical protein WAM28_08755 [Chlamydiales bacterium]